MAEIWGAAIAAGGAIGGGYLSSQGAKDAAAKSAAGSSGGIAEQARQYNTTRADTAPYRVIGQQALNALGSIYGYKPAATPMTYEQFSAANPGIPTSTPKKKKSGGLFGGGALGSLLAPTPKQLLNAQKPVIGVMQNAGIGAVSKPGSNPSLDAYNQYLAGFDYAGGSGAKNAFAPTGSGPKMNPRNGMDPSSGYQVGPGGAIRQGVTIDNDTGQVIDGSGVQPGYGGATAAGSPMPAGPDYSNFFMSPDYQFRRDQGIKGIERTASAQGLTGSGNALAALADYNSNLASGEFGNYFNRQAALAGIGQTAVNTATTAGMNAANNSSALLQSAANARASGIADSADAWGNALGTVAGIAYDKWGRPKQKVG